MLQELLDLFEVAHAWQINALALGMPTWIEGRDWKESQQLLELYERAELPNGVHQAALKKLLATGKVPTCPRASDLCRLIADFRPASICDAVHYLSTAKLPLISPDTAMQVLVQLGTVAMRCASYADKDHQLKLLNALQHMRTLDIPLSETVTYFAVKHDPEDGGVACANLSTCIGDMLLFHLCQAIERSDSRRNVGRGRISTLPWAGYLRPKT